jgi:hypothetical protein
LVEVLLYTELALVLDASYQLGDTWDQCYSALCDETNSAEATVADSGVVEGLTLYADFLDGEGVLSLVVVLPE